jgi:hypothetical protein
VDECSLAGLDLLARLLCELSNLAHHPYQHLRTQMKKNVTVKLRRSMLG